MRQILLLAVALGLAGPAEAVSWDQADPAAVWAEFLPAAPLVPAAAVVAKPSAAPPLPQSVVDGGLRMVKLIASADPSSVGFQSQAEVSSAVLAHPLREYFVFLDQLAAFRRGQDVAALLHGDEVTYLIEVNGRALSVLSFDYATTNGVSAWTVGEFGRPVRARAIEAVERRLGGAADADLFLVDLSPLHSELLVAGDARRPGAGQAYALGDDDRLGLQAGGSKDVGEVFAELQPHAQRLLNHPPRAPGASTN